MKVTFSLLLASISALRFIEVSPTDNFPLQEREFFESQRVIPVRKLLVAPIGGFNILRNRQSKSFINHSSIFSADDNEYEIKKKSDSTEEEHRDKDSKDKDDQNSEPAPAPSPDYPSKKKKKRFPYWPWNTSHIQKNQHQEYSSESSDSESPASASRAFDEGSEGGELNENHHKHHHGHHKHHHHHSHHHGHGHHHSHHHGHDSSSSSSLDSRKNFASFDSSDSSSIPSSSGSSSSSSSSDSSSTPPAKLLVDIIKIKEKVSETGESISTQIHNVILGTSSKDHKLHKLFTGDVIIKPIHKKELPRPSSHSFPSEEFLKMFSSSNSNRFQGIDSNVIHPMGLADHSHDSASNQNDEKGDEGKDRHFLSLSNPVDKSDNGNDLSNDDQFSENGKGKNRDFFDYLYKTFHLERTSHRLLFSFAVGFLFTLMLYMTTILICWFFGIEDSDHEEFPFDGNNHGGNGSGGNGNGNNLKRKDKKKKYTSLPQDDKKAKYDIQEIVIVNNKVDNQKTTNEGERLIESIDQKASSQ